jgi:acyl-CoA synthetase (AMP-forming)/AMP-acid ligase II
MLSHDNVCVNALGSIAEIALTDADTWAHIGPMFHLLDAWAIFAVTWVGAKHVFVPYFKPHEVLDLLESEHVTITALVPTMVNGLLNDPTLKTRKFKALRLIMTAGSPIAPEQVRKVVKTFSCDYVQFYGLTETSPYLTISTPKAHQLLLSEDQILEIKSRTGRPFVGVHVRVVREDGTDIERDNKEVGEIVAKGPVVFKGYWKQPETTAAAFVDGWFHTGDLAVMDEEGSINIVDRKKDMIISGGENIYSTEVEYAIYEHAAVQECAVLGLPDPEWGELVKAFVVLKQGQTATEAGLIEFVRHRLAKYKAPRSIEFVPELPKTGSGKIYKKGLREQATKKADEKQPQEAQKK